MTPQTLLNALVISAIAGVFGLGCAVSAPRLPLPPWEEWKEVAERPEEGPGPQVAEAELEDPFQAGPRDLVPREILDFASPVERDERLAPIEGHVARRMRKAGDLDPARIAGVILRAADWASVDPVRVLAMIEVESGFDPGALSRRGARGLMQLRPATLWRQAALSGLDGTDPHAPELNVPAGVLYYRRLLDTFRSEYLALVAYNAGPNRVAALLRSGGIPERFRDYPRRVFAAEERLRQSLGLKGPPRDPADPKRPLAVASGAPD